MLLAPPTLGVVPILVNLGTPLLPALAAGLMGFGALLLRPRLLLAAMARHRAVSVAIMFGGLGIAAGWHFLPRAAAAPVRTDWADVAREMLAKEADSSVLVPRWKFRPDGAMVLAAPVAAGGRIYGASALVDVAGNFGSIYCLDSESGQPVWQVEKVKGRDLKAIYSSPVLSEDGRSVIVGEGLHFDRDCALLCFDAATGELRWRVPVPLHLESTPAIRGDLVVVGAGAIEPGGHAPPTGEGFVLGVRISDGKELWRFPLTDVESSPAFDRDGAIYIGSGIGGNAVVALEGARLLWKTAAPHPVTGPITVEGDMVYAGAGRGDMVHGSSEPAGAVLALDRRSGALRWRTDLPDAVLGGLAVGDGMIFCPVRNGELVALDVADGAVLWRQRISGNAPLLSNVVRAEGRLYAVSNDGVLAVLAAADGAILDKQLLNDPADPGRRGLSLSSPYVADGRVYVGSETGGLRCFEIEAQ